MQKTEAPFEAPGTGVSDESGPALRPEPEERQRALALALEFSKRAQGAESLDELFFLLTNDLRILVAFDRAVVITHLRGESEVSAVTNQPTLEKKFPLVKSLSGLAKSLRDVDRGIVLSAKTDAAGLSDDDLSPSAKTELLAYVKESACASLVLVPLKHHMTLLGHLLLEFYEDNLPQQVPVLTLFSVAPLLASALAEKWLFQTRPRLWNQVFPEKSRTQTPSKRAIPVAGAALAVLVFVGLIFVLPITQTVGGEAEVYSHNRHMAFVKMDGLVERIFVKEGSHVEKDQVVAVLDRRELDHETKSAQRRLEILTREMMLLRREAGQDPAKLAESEQVQLKRSSVSEELEYLRWKASFLDVKAPAAGVVATKEVESLVGKRFRAGEPFCEIAAPRDLWIAVYVPEDKISLVRKGQPVKTFLNTDPTTGISSTVEEIAPLAQVLPRSGSVYRVSMPLPAATEQMRVGMKGIGKIDVGRMSLVAILWRHAVARWNHFSLYF
jgi:multidrug resistance efflux pump